jgi:CRISPR/Cas system-associated endonuclease Cas1
MSGMNKATILFVEDVGVTIVSRGGRLYARHRDEYQEIEPTIRVIIASGFGFVITADAIGVCAGRHIEVIITGYDQNFVAIYAPFAICMSNRASLAIRVRQFAGVVDMHKGLCVAKDIVRRKIIAEGHERAAQGIFLADLAKCRSVDRIRHVEARSAQEFWRRWKNFEIKFVKGFKPPERWRTFETRYIGRRQGKVGELPKQFTARFAESPLQAMQNFAVGIVVARITRVIAARGLDPCFGFSHNGRKPGRYSLSWDVIETCRPALAIAVFEYAAKKVFERADFAQQSGVVRLMTGTARECARVACETISLAMMVKEVKQLERML